MHTFINKHTHARPYNTHTHTHTHIHVQTFNRGLQPWIFDFRNFTCNRGHTLQSFHGWTWTCCVCVWNLTNHGLPLPLPKSIIGHLFLYACLCDLLPNGGSLIIVDVHGWCVSTVIRQFYWNWPWLKVLINVCARAHTHTHTYTHTHTNAHTHTTPPPSPHPPPPPPPAAGNLNGSEQTYAYNFGDNFAIDVIPDMKYGKIKSD